MGFVNELYKFKHQLVSSFRFYYEAKTLYNIHSPFLFKFLPLIFQCSKSDQINFKLINDLVRNLKVDTQEFEHTDFGEGSRTIKSNRKKSVRNVVKTSSTNLSKGRIIYNTVKYFEPIKTLELGTNLAIGSAYIAKAYSGNQVTTIEGDSFLARKSKENLSSLNIKNVNVIIDQFDNYLKDQKLNSDFDFVFIDGNHGYQATIRYFDILFNNKLENQVIILDDIYWSRGMTKAWNEIQNKLDSGYCINLFNIGIIVNSKTTEKVVKVKYIRKRWKPFSFGFWG